MKNDSSLEIDPLWRLPQVLAQVPVARSTWWLWVRQKKAPAPIKLSEKITCWRRSEVLAFLEKPGGVK